VKNNLEEGALELSRWGHESDRVSTFLRSVGVKPVAEHHESANVHEAHFDGFPE